jgi:RNA polymerase sigma factor (sigma-70 family)
VLHEEGETFEAFEQVQGRLLADDLALLRRYQDGAAHRARFSTWLVAVVHNLVIDWVRHRDGRRRVTMPTGLTPIQQQIYTHVFVEQRSHAESYGLLSARDAQLSHSSFLRELAGTYRAAERSGRGVARHLGARPAETEDGAAHQPAVDRGEVLDQVLRALPTEERLALQLYVVEEMPAAEVATVLGWPNAKWVYNRVYRGLQEVRRVLEE